MAVAETTTVQISKETRDLLRRAGGKGKSYDDIIRELLELREAFISDLKELWEEARYNREDLLTLEGYAEREGLCPSTSPDGPATTWKGSPDR